jgi:hypothetical protein
MSNDAWSRPERSVDAAIKSGPKRPVKKKKMTATQKRRALKPKKRPGK